VLTETPALDERLSATENLTLMAELFGVDSAEIPRRIHELLTLFDLADRAREKVGGYSKGMKQRLALARAILHQPRLLFLDEPTAALDPVATRHVHDLIARMAREEGRTIFLCTHNLVEAQRLCDRVAVMEQGRLLAIGSPHELARRYVHNLTVEIEVAPEQIAAARVAITGHNPALTLTPGHSGLLRVEGAGREEVPALVAALTTAGVRLYQVTPLEPSLEDVYFALHRAHERGEAEV
jgi:ABC-2 type transport system ATP-binding protein